MSATRTVLIVYPHWPPSNLVGVHRVRMVANHLAEYGWSTIVLTVHEDHYEESLSHELNELVNPCIEVEKVRAFSPSVMGMRLIGDIGLRGFLQLKRRARRICRQRHIDFIWFSIPSWYPPLMGAALRREFGIPYGIDYIDPWVFPLPEGTPLFSRAGLSQWAASRLEPRALRDCSLVTGINRAYFQGALDRNPEITPHTSDFQIGFDPIDHNREVTAQPPWEEGASVILYPGAFLPLSTPFYESLFEACHRLIEDNQWPEGALLAFIGTSRPDLPITTIATAKGVKSIVFESAERIPFLEVQQLLRTCLASLIVGSPEPHYSASKVFQCILSGRPVVAALHRDSDAIDILRACKADAFVAEYPPEDPSALVDNLHEVLAALLTSTTWKWGPQLEGLDPHHAREAAKTLAQSMETVLES